ncbi:MAG TPA: type IX secretion system membrane protein PorP/SprF [Bacteroidia bacterium]|jgi:type IX secretion system PorP/SprF family membrane protein|nr:type IX secretion system membrane protein PorP/SprF [Bacteroidia bacterium]
MKKITLSLIAAVALVGTGYAQQLPLYSQYYNNPFLYNPATTGVTGDVNAFLIHRSQWTGMPGGPVTNALTVDGFMDDKNVGLGINIFNDVQDINERMGIYTSYAYRLKINDDQQIRFGLTLGFLDNRIDFSKAVVKDAADPMLFSQIQHKSGLDANIGVSWNWKDLRVGFSVPQLIGQHLQYDSYDATSWYQLNRHFTGSVNYKYVFNEDQQLAIEPMVMVRFMPHTPFQYDVNVMGSWKDMIWLGASYRSNYAVGANVRVKLFGNLSAGYAYEFIITPLKTSAGISHEFMLGYKFGAMQSAASDGGHQRAKYD